MKEPPVDIKGLHALWSKARAKRSLDSDCVFCGGTTIELESPFCSEECLRASDREENLAIMNAINNREKTVK